MATYNIWNLTEKDFILKLNDDYKAKKLQNYMSQYFISDESLQLLKQDFEKEISNGLKTSDSNTLRDPTVLGMKLTFYTELFNGCEAGKYIVMYLSSRHLLLILAKIKPGFPVKLTKQYFAVSEDMRKTPYIKIFEFICECLLQFFSNHDLLGKMQKVGFCSDLPLLQSGIDQCKVWYFTPNAADFPLNCYDVRQCFKIVLLKERYRHIKINLVAVLNDKTSMLVQTSYTCGPIDLFLDLATDCNVLYWEKVANVEKWKSANGTTEFEFVLVDTELRNFGGNGCLDLISTDLEWSSETLPLKPDRHANIQRFISQHYVLELIKNILVDLHHDLQYCRQSSIGKLHRDGVSLESLCSFVKCEDIQHAAVILPCGTVGGSEEDAKVAKYVCSVVLARAAVLSGVCLSSLLSRSPKDDLVIAVNCPMLKKHPGYETYVRNIVKRFAPEKKFQLQWTKESVVCEGAVLATSIASRLDRTNLRF